jgi:hypothetical protein
VSEAEVNFPKLVSTKRCKNASVVAKRNRPFGAGEFLDKPEIPKCHNEPALVGVEKPVDFRLADWLPKGDARHHFASDWWLDCSGLLQNDFFRLFVFAEPNKHRLAQPLVARQLAKFDLTHQSRFHPMAEPHL